jgi:hypothetical protein
LGQSNSFHFLSAVLAITEGDLALFEAFQARVGNGDAKDVTAQIFQNFLSPAGRLSVHDPLFVLVPDLGRDVVAQTGALKASAEFGAKDLGESMHRYQELWVFGFKPSLAIAGQTARAYQKMGMGVIEHGACPSVQHR